MPAVLQGSSPWRVLTLAGYFGLLALLLNWLTWIAPPRILPVALALALLTLPLLLPLRGLLHGRPYTHAWASYLALFYFALGVDAVAAAQDPAWLGTGAIVASAAWFTGCVGYARTRGRELRAASAGEPSGSR